MESGMTFNLWVRKVGARAPYPDREPYKLWQVCVPLGLGFKESHQ